MSGRQQEQPTHRVMWWTRSFGRPLQARIGGIDSEIPEEFEVLLERADKRVSQTRCTKREN